MTVVWKPRYDPQGYNGLSVIRQIAAVEFNLIDLAYVSMKSER